MHHAYRWDKMDSRNRQNNPHGLYFLIRKIGIDQIIIYTDKRRNVEMQYTIVLGIVNGGIWHRDAKEYLPNEAMLKCSENNELWKGRVQSIMVTMASWNCWGTCFYFSSETTYKTWEYLIEIFNLFFIWMLWQVGESYRPHLKIMFLNAWDIMQAKYK